MRRTLTREAFVLVLSLFAEACGPVNSPNSEPQECVAYGAAINMCTDVSKTFDESVACENWWRARCRRPPRVIPPPLLPDKKDGGR